MKKMQYIFVEVKIKIDDSKYGQEAVIDAIQAYEGDELDHKFNSGTGWYRTSTRENSKVYMKKVELTKKRRRTLWNGEN